MSAGRDEGLTTISALRDRADALHRAGRLDDALAIFEEADLAASATEPVRLDILLRQGKLLTDQVFYADRGYDEAVATLDAARTLAKRLGDALAAATALDLFGMADYYRVMQAGNDDYGAALERFQEALAQREELNDTRGVAESLFHVGLIHERLRQYDQALDFYRRSYTRARERGHLLEQSYAARHLGGGAQEMGDPDAALAYFRESLALRQQVGYTLLLPLAHIALGEVTLAQRDVDGAAREYEQAYALAEGMQAPLIVVFTLLALSELAQARGDGAGQRDYAEQALSHAQEHEVTLGISVAQATLELTQESP